MYSLFNSTLPNVILAFILNYNLNWTFGSNRNLFSFQSGENVLFQKRKSEDKSKELLQSIEIVYESLYMRLI